MKKAIILILALIAIAVLFQNCAAPVYSELQSARLVGKGNVEVMPSASTVSFKSEEEPNDHVQDHLGMSVAVGLHERIDMRLRYETIWLDGEDIFSDNYNVVGLGTKYSFIKDRLAINLLFGTEISDLTEYWEFHPSLLATFPLIKDRMDFTFAPKYLFRPEEFDNLIATNFGLCFGALNKFEIRTEYGMLYNPQAKGHYSQFSFGFAYVFDGGKNNTAN